MELYLRKDHFNDSGRRQPLLKSTPARHAMKHVSQRSTSLFKKAKRSTVARVSQIHGEPLPFGGPTGAEIISIAAGSPTSKGLSRVSWRRFIF